MTSGISHDIAENELEVAHDDEYCQIDLEPVLPFSLLDLLIKLPKNPLPQRNQQHTQGNVVDLGVHNGRHGNDAIVWALRLVRRLKGWKFSLADTPGVLDEAGGDPEGQGVGDESALEGAC